MKYIIVILTVLVISCTSYKKHQKDSIYEVINSIPEKYCSIYNQDTYKLEVSKKSVFEDFINNSYLRGFPLNFIKKNLEEKSYSNKYHLPIKVLKDKVMISSNKNKKYLKKELFYKKVWKIKLFKEISRKHYFDGDLKINYAVNVFYIDEMGKEIYHYYNILTDSFKDMKLSSKIKNFMLESKLVYIKIEEKLKYNDIEKIVSNVIKELNIYPKNKYDIAQNENNNTWTVIIDQKVKLVISCLSKKIIEIKEIHEGDFDLSGINLPKTPKKFNCKNKE